MQNQKQSLIVGVTGQVGTEMLRALVARDGEEGALQAARRTTPGALRLDLAELETEDAASRLLTPFRLQAIYAIAGMTNVDGCEDAPEQAHRTNARGPAALAGYARRLGVPFVYFSTEYVFNGSDSTPGPYTEDAPTRPLNAYGRSKLAGERAVLAAHPEALILRTTVVYGPDPQGKNFVYGLLRNLRAGTPMRVPSDQVSTPTYNRDLIAATLGLVEAGASGIFHVCGPELLPRLEFARAVAAEVGLDPSLLHGVSTAELGQRAPRPLRAGLATTKLRTLYPQLRMRPVSQSIADWAPALEAALPSLAG